MTEDIQTTLAQRGQLHGRFQENADYSQRFKDIAQTSRNWEGMERFQREAIDMILHKIARILAGDHRHMDHWHDVAGYATLVSGILDTTGPSQ